MRVRARRRQSMTRIVPTGHRPGIECLSGRDSYGTHILSMYIQGNTYLDCDTIALIFFTQLWFEMTQSIRGTIGVDIQLYFNGYNTTIALTTQEFKQFVHSPVPNQQFCTFLKKKECTGKLSNTKRSRRPQSRHSKMISFITWKLRSGILWRREVCLCQSLQSRDAFMSLNTECLQQGGNRKTR